jgi:hypothetical protein
MTRSNGNFHYLLPALNILIKFINIALILLAVIEPDLPQFQGKAMGARLILYPLATLVVPIIWLIVGRRSPYPHLIDILVVLPFVNDTAGNALNLYNTTPYFDRYAHWFSWALLTTAFGSSVSVIQITRINVFALAIGFGVTTSVLWEIAEFILMQMGASGLQLTYNDTMDDLILSTLGSFVGSFLVITLFWRGKLMPSAE